FYSYDPKALNYIDPAPIPLRPDRATVGREIRVIGNDAGEQLSILAGTIARLDREAPNYGRGSFNDFNTFYIQAASSTSGGSSGSPVIDVQGNAVALNAGGATDAASSFFLPLDRVVRALRLVQQGKPVPRGSLETTFVHRPFDELQRLGLQEKTEARIRRRNDTETGMLVVGQVQPGGAAADALEPGDILVSINGELLSRFPALEAAMDSNVGKSLALGIERGGEPMEFTLEVTNLHEITPSRFISFGGGVVNNLSYQQARHLNREQSGVYVANPGYLFNRAGVPRGAVLVDMGGEPLQDITQFRERLLTLKQGERTSFRFFNFSEPQRDVLAIFEMDWRWFPTEDCTRPTQSAEWQCEMVSDGNDRVELEPSTVKLPRYDDDALDDLSPSLAFVTFDMPYLIDGVTSPNYFGTALITDAGNGYAVVDRNTVPVSMGDARLTFGGAVEVPARVVYVHPLHNLAVLKYDPALLGNTPVRSADLDTDLPKSGEELTVIGFKPDQSLRKQSGEMQELDPLRLPLSNTFRFREANMSTINLDGGPEDGDGVMVDESGDVRALWSSFAYQAGRNLSQTYSGMPAMYIDEAMRLAKANGDAALRSLEVEWYFMPMSSARRLGLPDEWANQLAALDPRERRVLAVERIVAGTPAEGELLEGDLLLAIDGEPVGSFRAVERASQQESVALTLFRDGQVFEKIIATVQLDGRDTDRVLIWAGAQLQEPHRAVAAQRGIPREGVFVSYFAYGSPASRYNLTPGRRIVEVNGTAVKNLDEFRAVVDGMGNREAVRMTTVLWDGRVEVITLKTDTKWWPSYELRRIDGDWKRFGPEQ
ncbi:MAG: PDZ domain-containing protein, partial [Gammaproteobacteria bacterium]|nr:PDZ domain-containing protein [Gammaproteobacteria bacterium]